jgi:hypothetical protein
MITPTIGRIVSYFEIPPVSFEPSGPLAAIVTHVWNDRMVNLAVLNGNGDVHGRTSVRLRQPEDAPGGEYCWCEWMPYQVKKPTGSESGEKAAGVQVIGENKVSDDMQSRLDNWFTYHTPKEGQPARYEAIRAAGKAFAQVICENTPPGEDRWDALKKIRETVMKANQAIACE